ncbi:MAG: hypothetical protein IJJ23_09790 [Clostridia bacterium]|nr:hypothetical protein [Clostridia bacterium]
MFGFEYPKTMPIGRVGLEVSLKPFGLDMSDTGIEKTCHELFDGWRELINHARSVAVLMWTSDGSEILEYNGDLDSTFDWARYIGIGNPKKELPPWDPEGEDLHSRPVLYMDNPPAMRYRDLQRIVSTIKRVGREQLNLEVEVGETFDPGPEFAYSDFKFHRHPELNKGSLMDNLWIHCAGQLKGDNYRYAAYPNGIPDGTYFGRFLGEQFMALKRDVGFDFIWLSNGFGFSLQSWNWKGELFDGTRFDYTNARTVQENIETFWKEFTAVTGDLRIETRGSNLSAGMDISAHGCPVDTIYRYPIVAPPNSPWAALDFRFGLELAGFMSRIARLPKKGYLFRYYTHDPWWHNSPWFDRYDRTPHDILLPLTIARMDEYGKVTPPIGINFLSADDSYGQLPRRCPVEVTPYLLDAYSHYPDEPGLVTWLYPFDSYIQLGLREGRMNEIFMDDWFIENAIDQGLPLNTVVADSVFLKADPTPYLGKVLIMPVPHADTPAEKALLRALDAGCRVLLYGNTVFASKTVRSLIGVREGEPIDGELTIETDIIRDTACDIPLPTRLQHISLLSDGGISELPSDDMADFDYPAYVTDGTTKRVYASINRHALNGQLCWMRASFPHDVNSTGALPRQLDKTSYFPAAAMLRAMLAPLGVVVYFNAEQRTTDLPVIHTSMNDNAFYITGFAKDTTVKTNLSYPDGAPLMEGYECILEHDIATYISTKCWHKRCRLFAKQNARSVVSVMRRTAEHPTMDERFLIRGLKDATLTLRPPIGARVRIVNAKNSHMMAHSSEPIKCSDDGRTITAEHLTGDYFVVWQSDHNPGSMLGENQMHPLKITETHR